MMPPARGLLNDGQVGLLDDALAAAHDDELLVLLLREFLDRQQRRDLLALFHRDEIGDGLALAAGADVRESRGPSASTHGRGRRRS